MKSKTIIITVFISLLVAILLVWGYVKNDNSAASVQGVKVTNASSVLTATSTIHDFGSIAMKNGNVSKDFRFTNSSEQEVVIRSLETSCMCTTAFLVESDGSTKGPFGMAGMGGVTNANETIRVGENRILRVVYDPKAHGPAGVGPIDRFITITDDSGRILRFEIKALVTP